MKKLKIKRKKLNDLVEMFLNLSNKNVHSLHKNFKGKRHSKKHYFSHGSE